MELLGREEEQDRKKKKKKEMVQNIDRCTKRNSKKKGKG